MRRKKALRSPFLLGLRKAQLAARRSSATILESSSSCAAPSPKTTRRTSRNQPSAKSSQVRMPSASALARIASASSSTIFRKGATRGCTAVSLCSTSSLYRLRSARSGPWEMSATFGSKCESAAFFSALAVAYGSGDCSSTR
jgi:hypothetical protein